MLLCRFGVDTGRDGDGALYAARRWLSGRGHDARTGMGQGHRGRSQRAAQFPHYGRAGDAVVAVIVVG